MYLPSLKVNPLKSSSRSFAASSVLASEPVRDVIRFDGVKISIGRSGYPTMLDSVPDPFRDLTNGQIARRCAFIAFILNYMREYVEPVRVIHSDVYRYFGVIAGCDEDGNKRRHDKNHEEFLRFKQPNIDYFLALWERNRNARRKAGTYTEIADLPPCGDIGNDIDTIHFYEDERSSPVDLEEFEACVKGRLVLKDLIQIPEPLLKIGITSWGMSEADRIRAIHAHFPIKGGESPECIINRREVIKQRRKELQEELREERRKEYPEDSEHIEALQKEGRKSRLIRRKREGEYRTAEEIKQGHRLGWKMYGVHMTVKRELHPDPVKVFKGDYFNNFVEFLAEEARKAINVKLRLAGRPHDVIPQSGEKLKEGQRRVERGEYFRHVSAVELGKNSDNPHMHAVIMMRDTPDLWAQDPNAGLTGEACKNRECKPAGEWWEKHVGFCHFRYLRYKGDIWGKKLGFKIPVVNGKPWKACEGSVESIGAYMFKYFAKEDNGRNKNSGLNAEDNGRNKNSGLNTEDNGRNENSELNAEGTQSEENTDKVVYFRIRATKNYGLFPLVTFIRKQFPGGVGDLDFLEHGIQRAGSMDMLKLYRLTAVPPNLLRRCLKNHFLTLSARTTSGRRRLYEDFVESKLKTRGEIQAVPVFKRMYESVKNGIKFWEMEQKEKLEFFNELMGDVKEYECSNVPTREISTVQAEVLKLFIDEFPSYYFRKRKAESTQGVML